MASLAIAFVVAVLGVSTTTAYAAGMWPTASSGNVGIALAGQAPSTLKKGDSLSFTVRVGNSTSTTLTGAKLTAFVGTRPLDTMDAQQAWSQGTSNEKRLLSGAKSSSANVPDLAPGKVTNVNVTVPASDLNFSYSMASLPVQIELDGDGIRTSLNSFVTWVNTDTKFTKMTASVVVPVTLPSDPALFTATGTERFEAWKKAIGPGSTIDKLLSTTTTTPVTWLIDPAVLEPPAAEDPTLPMPATPTPTTSSSATSSASASSSSGTTTAAAPAATPTTVEQLASRLRDKLASRPKTQQILFTPYGDPDLSALTAAQRPSGSDAALVRMLSRPLPSSLTSLSAQVVAAPIEPLSSSQLRLLTTQWNKARGSDPVILTPTATFNGGGSTNSAAQRTLSGVSVFGYDSNLSEALTDSEGSNATAISTLQANSLAIYQESPTTSRTLMLMGERAGITAPQRLDAVLNALKNTPWTQVSALDLKAATTTKNIASLRVNQPSAEGLYPHAGRAEITASALGSAQLSLSNLITVSKIAVQHDDIVPSWAPTLDQPFSTRYRSHYDVTTQLLSASADAVSAIPQQVSVQPTSINFFTDSGQISVTVKNNLHRTVNGLRLRLMPRSYAVQFKTQPAAFSLSPSASTAIRVPMVATAAGQVTISTSLTSANGVELGANENNVAPTLNINARPTGTWIYWVLGIVAFIVFCYGLLRARNKGTRRRDELARDIQS